MNAKKIFGYGLIAVILTLAFAALALTGCGDPESGPTGGGLKTLSGDVTIVSQTSYTTGTVLTAEYNGDEENVDLNYQWYKDGVAIPGETSSTYTPNEAGEYWVTVSVEGYKSKKSTAVTVTGEKLEVFEGAVIITPNTNVTVGTVLTAEYNGDEENVDLNYQWYYKDDEAIPDATDSTYTPAETGVYTVTVSADGYVSITSNSVTVGLPSPQASDFIIGNLTQIEGDVTAVTITPKAGKSGGDITVYYNGSTAIPQAAGTYAVTFDVANVEGSWNAATELSSGEHLTVVAAINYTITGNGTDFTATRGSTTVTTVGTGTIQQVIDAIRSDADGISAAIQFDTLDIDTASVQFNNTGGNWGNIILSGGIAAAATAGTSMITVSDGVSIVSAANIANAAGGDVIRKYGAGEVAISGGKIEAAAGTAVYNGGAGSITVSGDAIITSANSSLSLTNSGTINLADANGLLKITGGTVKNTAVADAPKAISNQGVGRVIISDGEVWAARGYAVYNVTGTVNISGGTVSTDSGTAAVYSNGTGPVNISGGMVSTTTGSAVLSNSTAAITVSGDAVVTAASSGTTTGTVFLAYGGAGSLAISGGTVKNTASSADAQAVYNYGIGAVTISGGRVEADTGVAVYNYSTGAITVSGTGTVVTSKNVTTTSGTIYLRSSGTATATRLTISGGTVSNTATTTNARAVYNASTGAVAISGGTVSTTAGYAVNNAGTGGVTISGGTVEATTGSAVWNASTGTVAINNGAVKATTGYAVNNRATNNAVNISGGTVEATTGRAVNNASASTINISGGTVKATTGNAVYNNSIGTITISGANTLVTSASTGTSGTIYLVSSSTPTTARLTISGGTVSNTATTTTARAVYNESTGGVTINGGTVSIPAGFAIQNTNADAAITLGGDPAITGRIRPAAAGKLSVTASGGTQFSPAAGRVYTLDYAAYTRDMVAVTGGGNHAARFALYNQPTYTLEASGGNVVVRLPSASPTAGDYNIGNLAQIEGEVTAVTITPKADAPAPTSGAIYYNGSTAIPQAIGTYTVTFDVPAAAGWLATNGVNAGTLTVREPPRYIITPGVAASTFKATKDGVQVGNEQTISSLINIEIRNDAGGKNRSIQFGENGSLLNIGTASVLFTNSISPAVNQTWGAITLWGRITSSNSTATEGTIRIEQNYNISVRSMADIANTGTGSDAKAIRFDGSGTLTIDGGTVSATSGNAVYNVSTGTVNINGGEVKATTGRAVYKNGTGAVNISGGTVEATTGNAVYNNSNGPVTVSGDALVTSANTSATSGTIYIGDGSISDRLIINGGTVKNTSTNTNARAVCSNASGGAVNISGGEVWVASGYAVYNRSDGAVNISGGTVEATTGNAVYNDSNGLVTVSGDALVTSANTSQTSGTIYIGGGGSGDRLIINGGTVKNTSTNTNARAVYNVNRGAITINGGEVNTGGFYAIFNTNADAEITLGGDPTITGRIQSAAAGKLSVTTSGPTAFNPGNNKQYILTLSSYAAGNVAVTRGTGFQDNFQLSNSSWRLSDNGTHLVMVN